MRKIINNFGFNIGLFFKRRNCVFNGFRHCVYRALFGDVLTSNNSLHRIFNRGEVLVIILVQRVCLGNGCIDLGVVGTFVNKRRYRIFNGFCHRIYRGLLGDVLTAGNSVDSGFYGGEVLIVILVQRVCLGNGFVNLSVVGR